MKQIFLQNPFISKQKTVVNLCYVNPKWIRGILEIGVNSNRLFLTGWKVNILKNKSYIIINSVKFPYIWDILSSFHSLFISPALLSEITLHQSINSVRRSHINHCIFKNKNIMQCFPKTQIMPLFIMFYIMRFIMSK